jgi:ABC-2 type transport system ATP-binding protein
VIQATELSKRYGATLALDRLTLAIPAGSAFGLLGPNGAGKSTFIKLLLGLIMSDGGQLAREGLTPQQIGYLPERPAMPPRSRVGEYLTLVGHLSGLSGRRLRSAVEQRLELAVPMAVLFTGLALGQAKVLFPRIQPVLAHALAMHQT